MPERTVTKVVGVVGVADVGISPLASACPAGFLPDFAVCVPFPDSTRAVHERGVWLSDRDSHDQPGLWKTFEHIPRRPDRPSNSTSYRFPVDSADMIIERGYDPDRPGAQQCSGAATAGAREGQAWHGGLDLSVPRGTLVRALHLAEQRGAAEVVFVGDLVGMTVVTRHKLEEAGRKKEYLLVHGHLDEVASGIGLGALVLEGEAIGTAGEPAADGRVFVHLEVRQVRDGVDQSRIRSNALMDPSVSIVCDPRNVLPIVDQQASGVNQPSKPVPNPE